MAGILSGPIDAPPEDRLAKVYPKVEAVAGLALTHRASGFSGALVRLEGGGAEIRGRTGLERVFRLAPGAFSVDGRAVSLVRSAAAADRPAAVTASGSVAVAGPSARVARAGRLWVEGVHDAELVERVWGDDLRVEGVVVERLDGIDQLAAAVIRWCRDQKRPQPPIVGFDDAPVAESLNLTTIAIPWDELVEGVVRVLKRRLAGDRSTSSQQIFHPRPVIRGFGLNPTPPGR